MEVSGRNGQQGITISKKKNVNNMIYGLDSITDKKAGSQSGAGRNKIFRECGQFGQDWK